MRRSVLLCRWRLGLCIRLGVHLRWRWRLGRRLGRCRIAFLHLCTSFLVQNLFLAPPEFLLLYAALVVLLPPLILLLLTAASLLFLRLVDDGMRAAGRCSTCIFHHRLLHALARRRGIGRGRYRLPCALRYIVTRWILRRSWFWGTTCSWLVKSRLAIPQAIFLLARKESIL